MKRMLEAIHARRRRRARLGAGAAVLCGAVVLAVGLGLMHPAITMGQEPECGYAEHTHTEACFEHLTLNPPLICGLEDHTHADLCYDAAGELTCRLPEHAHEEACYGEAQTVSTLTCRLPEHTHTESCYPETPEYTVAPEPHCGLAEHTHDEACGENCTVPEHTHTEACFALPAEAPEEEGEIPEEPQENEQAPEDEAEETDTALAALGERLALAEADRERLTALLERFGLTPEELLALLEEAEAPIGDLDSLEAYLAAFQETETLDGESAANPEATMEMQFFLTLKNFVPNEEKSTVHNSIDFSRHFCMTGTIKPITGYTLMEGWPMNPPSEDAWKAVVRANYPTLTEEDISHLEVVWVCAAPKSSDESGNNSYKDCQGHVDGYLRWKDGYAGPDLTTACGITLTAGLWWGDGAQPENATCVLLRKKDPNSGSTNPADYVEVDRKTFSRDPHTDQYDHIWTGLPGKEQDYAMQVDGLDTALWEIRYWDGVAFEKDKNFRTDLPFSQPSMFQGEGWGIYGYKMLAWVFRGEGSTGSLRLEKQTLLSGQSAPDITPENTLFTITNAAGTYRNTVKYRDFRTDGQGNRYLELYQLMPGRYTVTESGANRPGYVLEVAEDVTAEVTAGSTATASLTNTYTTGAVLPSTGGIGTPALYALGCGLSAPAGLGLLWRKRKKHE